MLIIIIFEAYSLHVVFYHVIQGWIEHYQNINLYLNRAIYLNSLPGQDMRQASCHSDQWFYLNQQEFIHLETGAWKIVNHS